MQNKYIKNQSLYQDMAELVATQSYCVRKQVGCVVVLASGTIATGYNGMPSGYDNTCELDSGVTNPLVLHAERNALDKLSKEGISPFGSTVYVTLSPCLECAKSLAAVGISKIVIKNNYKCTAGIDHLIAMGVIVEYWSKL